MIHVGFFGAFFNQLHTLFINLMNFMKILSMRANQMRTRAQFLHGANHSVSPTRIESSIVLLVLARARPLRVRAA